MPTATEWDYKSWIQEAAKQAGLDDDAAKQLETVFGNEKVRKYAGESFLRQSDYSRKQNELKAKIQTKEAEITAYEGRLHDWENQTKEEIAKTERARDAALKNLNKLQEQFKTTTSKLKSGYDEYGLPVPEGVRWEPELDPMDAAPAAPVAAPTGAKTVENNPNYVTREDYAKALNASLDLPFELLDIAEQHRELFGKGLTNMAELKRMALAEKVPVREVWERENNVSGRRQELAQEDFNRRVNEAADAKFQEKMSNAMTPNPSREAHRSAVLNHRFSLPNGEENKTPAAPQGEKDPMRGVMAAVQAHMRGDYKPGA